MLLPVQRPLWFKAKRYGYGWYPATWQGWMVLCIWIVFFIGAFVRWDIERQTMQFLCDALSSTAVLLVVCWLTGEQARWRWGN